MKEIHHVETGGIYIEPGTGEVKHAVVIVYPDGHEEKATISMTPKTMERMYEQAGAMTVSNLYIQHIEQLVNPQVDKIQTSFSNPATGEKEDVVIYQDSNTRKLVVVFNPGTPEQFEDKTMDKYQIAQYFSTSNQRYIDSKK